MQIHTIYNISSSQVSVKRRVQHGCSCSRNVAEPEWERLVFFLIVVNKTAAYEQKLIQTGVFLNVNLDVHKSNYRYIEIAK